MHLSKQIHHDSTVFIKKKDAWVSGAGSECFALSHLLCLPKDRRRLQSRPMSANALFLGGLCSLLLELIVSGTRSFFFISFLHRSLFAAGPDLEGKHHLASPP